MMTNKTKQEYHENGILKWTGNYDKNGKRTGKGEEYDKNGVLRCKGEYDNGKRISGGTKYDENGDLIEKNKIIEKNKKPKDPETTNTATVTKVTTYHKNGKCKSIITYDKDNKKNGYAKEYYANGICKCEGDYVHGTPKGTIIKYYYGGQYKSTTTYNDKGEIVSMQKYYQNGKLLFESSGKANPDGTYKVTEYDVNGDIIFDGYHKDGRRWNGEGKEYNDSGLVTFNGTYENGKPTDPCVRVEYDQYDNIVSCMETKRRDTVNPENEITFPHNYLEEIIDVGGEKFNKNGEKSFYVAKNIKFVKGDPMTEGKMVELDEQGNKIKEIAYDALLGNEEVKRKHFYGKNMPFIDGITKITITDHEFLFLMSNRWSNLLNNENEPLNRDCTIWTPLKGLGWVVYKDNLTKAQKEKIVKLEKQQVKDVKDKGTKRKDLMCDHKNAKITDKYSHTVFTGEIKDEKIRNGIGKLYDKNGKLLFYGQIIKGKAINKFGEIVKTPGATIDIRDLLKDSSTPELPSQDINQENSSVSGGSMQEQQNDQHNDQHQQEANERRRDRDLDVYLARMTEVNRQKRALQNEENKKLQTIDNITLPKDVPAASGYREMIEEIIKTNKNNEKDNDKENKKKIKTNTKISTADIRSYNGFMLKSK